MTRSAAGWDASAQAWIDLMRQGEPHRTHLLDPMMLEACGEVAGLRVADIGCGEGRFCRMLRDRGARVLGIDPTPGLIAAAKRLDPDGWYIGARAEDVPVQGEAIDLVVSYLSLIDIPDYRRGIAEMARLLVGGGRLVIANLNSFVTTTNTGWYRDENGRKLYVPVDRYMEERSEAIAWAGISVLNWHRPFGAYMDALLDRNLRLTSFRESAPTRDALAARPVLADQLRVPSFHVMAWTKE